MFFNHEIIDIESIIPFAMNSRLHSDAQVAQLAASIREFGFTNPVLIDEAKNLIAGHGRVMAARKLGLKSVPAILVTGLDERKRRALVIADNKLAMNATWDEDVLKNELQDLAGDFGQLMGFSENDLAAMLPETQILDEMPVLRDGEKEPFQQKTFTLHDDQARVVDNAITLARTSPLADTGLNENTTGNALALICQQWLEARNGKR
jgi:ParB-like chromosome segregation protein Spo0J